MKTVTFYGGFHNAGEIKIRVNNNQLRELKEGFYPLGEILSDYQIKRLNRHFCGVRNCTCGGAHRATIEF